MAMELTTPDYSQPLKYQLFYLAGSLLMVAGVAAFMRMPWEPLWQWSASGLYCAVIALLQSRSPLAQRKRAMVLVRYENGQLYFSAQRGQPELSIAAADIVQLEYGEDYFAIEGPQPLARSLLLGRKQKNNIQQLVQALVRDNPAIEVIASDV